MAQATEDKGPAGRIVFSATTARRGRQSRVSKNWVPAGIHKIAMKRNLWVFVLGRSCWAVTACLGAAGRVCEPDPSFRCRTLDHLEGGPADPGSRNRPAPPATVVLGSGGGHSPGRRALTVQPHQLRQGQCRTFPPACCWLHLAWIETTRPS